VSANAFAIFLPYDMKGSESDGVQALYHGLTWLKTASLRVSRLLITRRADSYLVGTPLVGKSLVYLDSSTTNDPQNISLRLISMLAMEVQLFIPRLSLQTYPPLLVSAAFCSHSLVLPLLRLELPLSEQQEQPS